MFTSQTFAVILQQSPDSHLSRVRSLLSIAQGAVLAPAAPLLGRLASTAGTTFTLGVAGAAPRLGRRGRSRRTGLASFRHRRHVGRAAYR